MHPSSVLIRDGRIAEDDWTLIRDGVAQPGVIAPLDAWRAAPDGAGVWIDGDAEVEDIAREIAAAPVVAVRFPVFSDGRGLSFGALLRRRYGYRGELRACGEIVPDLAHYLHRCGFNAFVLPDRRQAEVALACMDRMSDHYQSSVRRPEPPFLDPARRA